MSGGLRSPGLRSLCRRASGFGNIEGIDQETRVAGMHFFNFSCTSKRWRAREGWLEGHLLLFLILVELAETGYFSIFSVMTWTVVDDCLHMTSGCSILLADCGCRREGTWYAMNSSSSSKNRSVISWGMTMTLGSFVLMVPAL